MYVYQVSVSVQQRDHRFLWWGRGDMSKDIVDCRMHAHISGASSSPAVAKYALRKQIWIMQRTAVQRRWWLWNIPFMCASARFYGVSLNDRFLSGPDLSSSLIGTHVRFTSRESSFYGWLGMYVYRVSDSVQQRDLRFLWWPQGDASKDMVECWMHAHISGASSCPAVARYGLRKTALDNTEKCSPGVLMTVKRTFMYASARFDGVSFNDRFLSGPDLSSSLIGTHVRFRQERVAVMADFECMFTESVTRFSREISVFCGGLKVIWARIWLSVGCMQFLMMQKTAVQRCWWLQNEPFM